jgi:hypothetical protein
VRTPHTTSSEPPFRTIDGLSIRYADSGGAGQPTMLLTSPWPESMYAFAPMRATLAEHAHIDAGHFVWEAAPTGYASTILPSIAGAAS